MASSFCAAVAAVAFVAGTAAENTCINKRQISDCSKLDETDCTDEYYMFVASAPNKYEYDTCAWNDNDQNCEPGFVISGQCCFDPPRKICNIANPPMTDDTNCQFIEVNGENSCPDKMFYGDNNREMCYFNGEECEIQPCKFDPGANIEPITKSIFMDCNYTVPASYSPAEHFILDFIKTKIESVTDINQICTAQELNGLSDLTGGMISQTEFRNVFANICDGIDTGDLSLFYFGIPISVNYLASLTMSEQAINSDDPEEKDITIGFADTFPDDDCIKEIFAGIANFSIHTTLFERIEGSEDDYTINIDCQNIACSEVDYCNERPPQDASLKRGRRSTASSAKFTVRRKKSGLSGGAIAGIVIGSVAGVGLLGWAGFSWRKRNQNNKGPELSGLLSGGLF